MEQLKRILGGLTWRQRITILAVAIGVIGGLVALTRWNSERDFRPLYSGLSAEDAGAVLVKLRELAVEYRVSDNGTTVLAPSSKVAETRLQLAAAGPPNPAVSDSRSSTNHSRDTEFTEQVNYHRALGEWNAHHVLPRSGRSRHLTCQESVFAEPRQPAKASVLVKLRPSLLAAKVSAVCSLIASGRGPGSRGGLAGRHAET
jgi:flagellar M-ring protein FliF